jgi:Fur family transcriptional regulator, ferric uptake regulator
MSRSPHGRKPQPDLRAQLHERGMRATPARIAVLSELRQTGIPMTHAEVVELLAGRGGDPATVFRNLAALTEAGFVRRSDLGDHVWRFESLDGSALPTRHEHPHFLCTRCGTVQCMPELQVEPRRGARVPRAVREHTVEVQLKGVCDSCAPES